MGTRGPAPQSNKTKELNGNPGRRALTGNSPQPDRTPPSCPDWLDDIAKDKWAELSPELVKLGLLTSIDGDTFAVYCQAFAEFQLATQDLKVEGRVMSTRTGYLAPHPAVAQQRSAWATMKTYSALFGLDPVSRARISGSGEADEEDPFEAFLKKSN